MIMTLEEKVSLIAVIQEEGDAAVLREAAAAIRERDELNTERAKQASMRFEERLRAERAEAELAVLKARIAEAPVYTCEADIISGRDRDYISAVLMHDDPAFQYPDMDGRRIRLIVEE